jgi:hypothetical protein
MGVANVARDLSWNQLNGSLPEEWSALTGLERMCVVQLIMRTCVGLA